MLLSESSNQSYAAFCLYLFKCTCFFFFVCECECLVHLGHRRSHYLIADHSRATRMTLKTVKPSSFDYFLYHFLHLLSYFFSSFCRISKQRISKTFHGNAFCLAKPSNKNNEIFNFNAFFFMPDFFLNV